MAITRAQQVRQMLEEGGRIGFANGAQFAAARRGESISPGTKGRLGPGPDRKPQTRDDNPLFEQYEGTTEMGDVGDVPLPTKKVQKDLKDKLRDKNPSVFDQLIPSRRNLFKRALVLPGAKERIRDQRKAYAEYLESMGVVPSSELTDTDDLFSFFEEQAFEEGPTVPGRTIKSYGDFILDEFGNPTVKYRGDIGAYRRDMGIDDRGPDDQLKALVPAQVAQPIQEPTEEKDDPNRFFRLFAEGGSVDDIEREAMFLGGITKGIKKAVRGVKKIAKSPIGKIAIGALLFRGAGGMKGLTSLFGKGSFNPLKQLLTAKDLASGEAAGMGLSKFGLKLSELGLVDPSTMGLTSLGKFAALGIPSALAGAMTDEQKDEFKEPEYPEFNMQAYLNQPFQTQFRRLAAEGGDVEPVAKKTMPLLDLDGQEMDFRAEGGFVPIGRMEKADDVPARLSKNEFVFTADAVRNAGDGDVDKGAEVMYNMMKNLESGGEVSEESQGLEGARKMFQTSQRLEEVL
jgi:hypothetical protein